MKITLEKDFVITENIEPISNLPFTLPAGSTIEAFYNGELESESKPGLNNPGKKYNVYVSKIVEQDRNIMEYYIVTEIVDRVDLKFKLAWFTREELWAEAEMVGPVEFNEGIIMTEELVYEIFNITITEKQALELALDELESLYDPYYMELIRGDEWICILLDGTVALAGEYQDMDIEDEEDAEWILYKFEVGKLVEDYFEFKRKPIVAITQVSKSNS